MHVQNASIQNENRSNIHGAGAQQHARRDRYIAVLHRDDRLHDTLATTCVVLTLDTVRHILHEEPDRCALSPHVICFTARRMRQTAHRSTAKTASSRGNSCSSTGAARIWFVRMITEATARNQHGSHFFWPWLISPATAPTSTFCSYRYIYWQ